MKVELEFDDDLSLKLVIDKLIDNAEDVLNKEQDFSASWDVSGVARNRSFNIHIDAYPTDEGYTFQAKNQPEVAN